MTLALTEANVNALITAFPPTLMALVTLFVLRSGQKKNAIALDGKLTQLMNAEKGVARAEGAAQERSEERGRKTEEPQPVTVENTPESPVIVTPVKSTPQRPRGKSGKAARARGRE